VAACHCQRDANEHKSGNNSIIGLRLRQTSK
jgi:hypothetical protein